MEKDSGEQHVEKMPSSDSMSGLDSVDTMGTVKLTDGKIIYIPSPTADPQDPLNMKPWQKLIINIVVSTFSTLGLSLVSGYGGLLGFYIPKYAAVGKTYADITHLMTYPTLFMGIGNLIGMPLAMAVGRRPVLLVSTVILVVSAIVCATAKTYEWQLGGRMILGIAAGQSESVVPLIIQEIYFLHERSRALMVQQTIQVILTAIYTIFASPIAGAISPEWWYGLGAALAVAQLALTIVFLPETRYERPIESFQEATTQGPKDVEASNDARRPSVITTLRPELDYVNFAPRTWKSDMRLFVGPMEWHKAVDVWKQTFTVIFFPNVFWAMCMNGLLLGVNIAIGTTYGSIVTKAPYFWSDSAASYANAGQIVTALVALPVLGYGSDMIIKWKAQRNGGIHEPENRLIPLAIPMVIGIFTCVLYGLGAANPYKYHWFVYVWAVAAYFFAFVGANIVAITYLLDSYPARAGPVLVVICAFRGIISFGVSYGIAPFIQSAGYDGAFGAFAGLTALFALLAIPIYFFGKRIRAFTSRWAH